MVSPRTVDLAGRAGTIVLALAGVAWVALAGVRPMRSLSNEAHLLRQAIGILGNAEGGVEGLREEITRASNAVEATNLPHDIELERFLKTVEETARRARVRIDGLAPDRTVEHPLYREEHLRLRAVGEFTSLYLFLAAIERSDPLTRVEELSLLAGGIDEDCVADVHLVLFSSGGTEG